MKHYTTYIQLLESFNKNGVYIPARTILESDRTLSSDGKYFHIVSFQEQEHVITCNYRALSELETQLYQQELICVYNHYCSPVTEDNNKEYLPINLKSGDIVYVEGYIYCDVDKQYVPYFTVAGIRYEIMPNMMIQLESYLNNFFKTKQYV